MSGASTCKTISNREKLIQEIESKITKETKDDIVDFMLRANIQLYGGISIEEGTLLFLHWLCYYLSYQRMQKEFEYPHSNYENSFVIVRNCLTLWARSQIGVPKQTYQDRLEIALGTIPYTSINDCTLILHDIHFPILNAKNQRSQRNFSYRLNRTARAYQIAITQDKSIFWISKGFGASRNNLDCMSHSVNDLRAKMAPEFQDLVMVDNTYRGLEQFDIHTCTPIRKRKLPNGEMETTPEDEFNQAHRIVHDRISEVFTALQNKFAILANVFRGPSKRQKDIVLICCAIYNNDLRVKNGLPRNYLPEIK